MAPKKKAKDIKDDSSNVEEADHPFQAVVLCDSFDKRLRPMITEKPSVLFPLANTPLLGYTLEFLESGGVEDVYLICTSHANQIQEYIKSSKWSKKYSALRIHTIVATTALSIGDALRELDTQQLIKSDFVLVRGDVVSNITLQNILEEHKKRKELDKNMIMTMITPAVGSFHKARDLDDAAVFAFDRATEQLVHYESVPISPRKRYLSVAKGIFEKHAEVEFRNDLIDSYIDICTPEVPALFSENFDYQDMRKDFVHGMLTSDLLGKTIYCHVPNVGYSVRVSSLSTYFAVSEDVIARQTFPLSPEMNLQNDQTYTHMKDLNSYLETNIQRAPSCQFNDSVIGSESVIEEDVILENTVIGRRCIVRRGATIRNSILWDDVQIGVRSTLEGGLLADKVVVGQNCRIGKGSVMATGVKLQDEFEVEEGERWIRDVTKEDTNALLYGDSEGEDESEEEDGRRTEGKSIYNLSELNLSDSSVSSLESGSDDDDHNLHKPSVGSFTSATSDDLRNNEFYTEAQESLDRAFAENHSVEDAAIELKTLRMATNVTFHEVRWAVVSAVMHRFIDNFQEEGKQINVANVDAAKLVQRWGPLIDRVALDTEGKVDILSIVQQYFARQIQQDRVQNPKLFVVALTLLYEKDVVDEEEIHHWYDDERSKGETGPLAVELNQLRKVAEGFVNWLRDAEEESDDE